MDTQTHAIDGVNGGAAPSAPLTLEAFARGMAAGIEERARAAGVDLNNVPDITEFFDMAGGGKWAPKRPADFDVAAWGEWEAWEHCEMGTLENGCVGAKRTGDWIAWHAPSGAHLGFGGEKAREKAEMLAVLKNENAPTRVVLFDGSYVASTIDFDQLNAKVDAGIERLLAPAVAEEASEASPQL